MNNNLLTSLLLASALFITPLASAETSTLSGTWSGNLTGADVESTGNTTVMYRKPEQEPWKDHGSFAIGEGAVSFTWHTDKPDQVEFNADLNFGSHSTDTHAKVTFFNIKSTQNFFDEIQHVKGRAKWDAAARTLTYKNRPEGDDRRDDSGASTVTQSKEPTCVEADSRACKAFFKGTREAEGLILNLTFNEDLSRFEGKAVLIQYGGSGMEKSSTDLNMQMSGTLAAQ